MGSPNVFIRSALTCLALMMRDDEYLCGLSIEETRLFNSKLSFCDDKIIRFRAHCGFVSDKEVKSYRPRATMCPVALAFVTRYLC